MADEEMIREPARAGYRRFPHNKVLASLGGALIIYVFTETLTVIGYTINEPLKNGVNAIVPVVAGYMWPSGGPKYMQPIDIALIVVLFLAAVALLFLGARH